MQTQGQRGERRQVGARIGDDFMRTIHRDIQYPRHLAIAGLLLGEEEKAPFLLAEAVGRGFWNHRFRGNWIPAACRFPASRGATP